MNGWLKSARIHEKEIKGNDHDSNQMIKNDLWFHSIEIYI